MTLLLKLKIVKEASSFLNQRQDAAATFQPSVKRIMKDAKIDIVFQFCLEITKSPR